MARGETADLKGEAFALALEAYLGRATADGPWREIYRRSVDRLLAELTAPERERLWGYAGQFSLPSATFIARRAAEVWALALEPVEDQALAARRQQAVAGHLARFRGDFTSCPPGQEEGKRPGDAPCPVFRAALRRRQGGTPRQQQRVAASIARVMEAFAPEERGAVEELFESWPVEAVDFALRIWLWLSDDAKRLALARQQYRQWAASGDPASWWAYFDVA